MGLFKNYKRQAAWTRKQEETVYEFIAEEMEKGIIRKGLMAKALSESEGNQERADGAYIKLRFQSIKDEFVIFEEFLEAIESKLDNKKDEKNLDNRQEEKNLTINDFNELHKKNGTHKYQYKAGSLITYTVMESLTKSASASWVSYKTTTITIDKCIGKPHYEGKTFNEFWEFEDFVRKELTFG